MRQHHLPLHHLHPHSTQIKQQQQTNNYTGGDLINNVQLSDLHTHCSLARGITRGPMLFTSYNTFQNNKMFTIALVR